MDRTVGNVVDSIPAASFTKPAQQDEGGSRHLSVQDRISLFESKQKEQSVNSRNISTIVGIKRVVAGKGEPRRIPSDVSDKSVLKCHAFRRPQFETTSVDYVQTNDHVILQATSQSVSAAEEKAGLRDQESSRTRTGKISSHPDGVRVNYQPTVSTQLQIFAKKPDDAQVGTKDPSDFQINSRALSGIYLESHPQWTPLSKPVGADSSGTVVSEQPFGPIIVKEKGDLGHLGINFKDQLSSSDCPNKFQSETTHSERYSLPVFPVRDAKECMELLDPPSTCSAEQIQMVSSLKGGNQKLNNELQMKANELENFFAEHKLRIQKDQATTFQRSSAAHKDHVLKALEKGHAIPVQLPERKFVKETSKKEVEFDANLLSNMVNNRKFDNNLCQGFDNKSDDFRGKFYDKYMQKRNAKLLEEWKSKRPQKEAKMKALRDNLEHTLAEMRAKFIGSANGQYLRSFSCSSVL